MTSMHSVIPEEKLTEAYRLLLEMRDNCVKHADDKYDDPMRKAKYEALNIAITAMGRSIPPRWISVEERLPEVDKLWTDKDTNNGYKYSADLLVYDGVRTRVAYYCHTTKWWYDSRYEDDIIDVTHWMPLPEPPEEEPDA